MKAHKKAALIRLAGAAKVEAILAHTDARIAAAKHIGLTQMESGQVDIPQTTSDAGEAITSSSEANAETVETPAAEAAPAAETEIAAQAAQVAQVGQVGHQPQVGQQGETDVKATDATEHGAFLLGDMTPAEFTTLLGVSLAKSLSDAFAGLVPQLASAQLTTKAADDIVALTNKVDELTKRLEDESPRDGYRPVHDPDAIVLKEAAPRGPQMDPRMAAALELVQSLNGQNGLQA